MDLLLYCYHKTTFFIKNPCFHLHANGTKVLMETLKCIKYKVYRFQKC